MIVPLDEKLRIRGTETCWQLERLRKKSGSDIWEPFKWFSSFRMAVEEAVQREIRLHPASTLSEAIDAVSEVSRRFSALIPDDING